MALPGPLMCMKIGYFHGNDGGCGGTVVGRVTMGRSGPAVRMVTVDAAGMTADSEKTLSLLGPGGANLGIFHICCGDIAAG